MSSERRNLTEPGDWWDAFEAQAAADGQTLSEWDGDCMRANLPKGGWYYKGSEPTFFYKDGVVVVDA